MIVTCEECSTSFQLDESRIPASGARVRCSRCKHAFFLPHPSASQQQAVHSVAETAAADPQAPPPTDDLGGGAPSDVGLAAGDSVSDFDDEEEWQFSEEVRIAGDEPDDDPVAGDSSPFGGDVAPEVGETTFGESSVFDAGFDETALGGGASSELAPETPSDAPAVEAEASIDDGLGSGLELDMPNEPSPTVEPERDDSSFGTVDDFSSLMEDDAVESAPAELDSGAQGELDDGLATSTSVGTYAEKGTTDDLGDPESWDLVGGDDLKAARPSLASVSRSFTEGLGDLGEPISADEFFGRGDDTESDEVEGFVLPPVLAKPLGLAARTVGWAVTLGLVGAFLLFGARAELGRWAEAPQRVRVGAFEAITEAAGWVETSRAGHVLRFTGRIKNHGDAPVWPGAVRLTLLDDAGERLRAAPVSAGSPLATRMLREAPLEQLAAVQAAAIRSFASTALGPGEERSFEVLVPERELPRHAQRVLLEVGEPRRAPDVASALPPAVSGTAGRDGGAPPDASGTTAQASGARPQVPGSAEPSQAPVEPGLSP